MLAEFSRFNVHNHMVLGFGVCSVNWRKNGHQLSQNIHSMGANFGTNDTVFKEPKRDDFGDIEGAIKLNISGDQKVP